MFAIEINCVLCQSIKIFLCSGVCFERVRDTYEASA